MVTSKQKHASDAGDASALEALQPLVSPTDRQEFPYGPARRPTVG